MSKGFWIENITYSGEHITPTKVEFRPGFNIVHGPSDTGKTYLAKTIKYMLAGATKPFPTETGYSVITMTLCTDEGKVKLTRKIGSAKMTVSADPVFGIPYGEYAVHPSELAEDKMTVSDVLLSLLGVTERRVVLTSQYGSRKPLTWKTFSDTLHRSEGHITSEESIFSTAKYATLSAFLTLFYDQNLSQLPEQTEPAELAAKKRILGPMLDERMQHYLRYMNELRAQLDEMGDRDVDKEITALSRKLEDLSQSQDVARTELSELTQQISATEQELSVQTVSASRYDDLASVYLGNIKRLTFITDAQDALGSTEPPVTCPFCDNPLATGDVTDYRQAAQAEAEAIANDLKDLSQVRATLHKQIMALRERLAELHASQHDVESRLSHAVLPQITQLRAQITSLSNQQRTLAEYSMAEANYTEVIQQLNALKNERESAGNYNPLELFPLHFYSEMSRYLREILAQMNYTDAEKATFDANDFDLRIGGKAKRSHGKGYRAFFNTVVLLALRRYIHEHANHKPSLVVIDTPTLGLEHQQSGEGLVTSRDETGRPKTGLLRNLFDYMVDDGVHGQLIVLNNTDVTPTTNFNSVDSTELVFGPHERADRPGLLISLQGGDKADEIKQPGLFDHLDNETE